MSTNFTFEKTEIFRGYNSASDKTKLPKGFLIRGSKNVIKRVNGRVGPREGIKLRGETDDTDAGTKSSYEWHTNVGTTRNLRVNNGKLQVESDIESEGDFLWYDLLETGTLAHPAADYTRFVFDTWWDDDEQTDRLLMVRGDTNILHWSGGMALVDSIEFQGGSNYSVASAVGFNGYFGSIDILAVDGTGKITSFAISDPGSSLTQSDVGIIIPLITMGGGTAARFILTSVTASGTIGGLVLEGRITKQGTESWAEVGFATNLDAEKRIIINGIEYQYDGGEDTTTLTKVYGTSTLAGSSGDVVIQSVMVDPPDDLTNFDFDFIKTVNNQIWAGSYSSRIVYISADITAGGVLGFLNYIDTTSHIYGDPDNIVLDNQCRGIGVKDGKVILFAGESDMYIVTPNQNVTHAYTDGDGQTRYNFQKIDKKQLNGMTAALGHEFIDNFGEYLIWIDQRGQLRALGTFSTIDTLKPTTLSLPVKDELFEEDFTGGHLRVIEDTIHITAPNTGRDWVYTIRDVLNEEGKIVSEILWQPPQIRGIARIAVIDGEIFGHSNAFPQLYQLENTGQYADDHPSGDRIAYTSVARFSYQHLDDRNKLLTFDMITVEGFAPEGTELKLKTYIEYQGSKKIYDKDVMTDEATPKFYGKSTSDAFGDYSLGVNPLGEGVVEEPNEQHLVPKFRSIVGQIGFGNCFEFSPEFYSEEADSRWELTCYGVNIEEAEEEPVFLRKRNSN